jgi:hypothetical protein
MERKTFIGAAAVTAAAAAGLTPAVSRAAETWQHASNRNIRYMIKIIQATADDLNQDAADYSGYRVQAMQNLQSAIGNLQQALSHID